MSEIVANAGVSQFQLLYLDRYCHSNRMTSAGSMLLSSLLAIALWPLVAHEALLGWLLLQGLLQTGHAYYSRRYMQMRAAGAVYYSRWMRGFQIGALVKGASWSLPFFFLSVEHDHPEAILLSFAVAGVTAYAGVAMAVVLPVALAFELAAVLPMSAWMFMQDDRIYYYMGTAALLYLGLLYLLLRQLHASSARSFVLGEENRRLADEQRESELRMARYFENAPGFFYTEYMNGGGKSSLPFASTGIRELFDVTAEEVKESTAPLFSQVCANDLESFVVARDASCKNLSGLHLEFRINHRLKGERWIELNALPQREADGATVWHGFMQDITGRKHLEDALIARERDFRNLAENLPVAVIRYDSECKRRYLNRAAEKALHGSAGELLGHVPGGQVVPATPAMIAHYRDKMEESLATGEARELDFVLDELPADQQEHYEVRFVPEYAADGKPDGVLAIWYDISERKRMEDELRLKESVLDQASDSVYLIDENARFVYVNDQACRALGYSREALLSMGVADIDHSYSVDDSRAVGRKSREEGAFAFETQHRRRDGSLFPVEIQASALVYEGKHLGLAVARDISERKQAEAALEESNLLLRNVLQGIPDPVWMKDADGAFVACNQGVARLFNMKVEEIIGKDDYDFFPPEQAEFYQNKDRAALEAGHVLVNEEWWTFADNGEQALMETCKTPVRSSDGRLLGVLGVARDITERKAIERSLYDSERMLQEAQRIAHVGSWDVDMVNDRLTWSDEIFRIWELDKTKFRADFAAFLETVHPEDRERVNRVYHESVVNHTLYEVEHRLLFPDGRVKHIQERGEPQYDAQGKPVRFIGTSFDITERKLAEQYEQFRSHTLERLAGNHALPAILDEIVRGVEQLNSRMLCSILLLDGEGKHLVDGIAPSLPDFYNEAIDGLEIGVGVGSCGTCAATGERIIVEDIQTHPYWAPFKELTTRAGLGACWSQPILSSSGKVLGTFAIYHREAHAPTAQDISLIEKVAHIASIAIERKRMEADLAERERDFRNLAENLPDNIARWDVEGRYLYINPTHERTLGITLSEVVGTFIPDTHEHVKKAIAQVVASGRAVELVRQSALVDGELQIHEVTLVPEFDAAGHVVSVLGLGRNMTEFFRMQDVIAAREQEFRSLAESSPDAIVRYDREGRHRYLNITLVRILGLSSVEEVIGKRPAEVWPDGRFDPIEQAAARAIETGDVQIIEMHSPGESGELVESLISVVPERDEHGSIVGTLAFGKDITAIRATERKLAHFVDNLPGMAYTFRLSSDGAMGFTYVSPAIEEIYGLTEQEARGDFHAVHTFVPAEDRERIETAVAESARNLSPKYVEFRICRPGQPERWLDARSLPERQSDGSILWYGIMLDVTERKRMEGALAERQAFLDSLFEAIPVPVFYKDREGRYLGFNRAYESVFGASREQLIGKSVFDTHPRELAETYHAKDAEVFERRVALQQYEYKITHANGTLRDVLFSKAAFTDAHGEVSGLIGAVIDITERKRAELALRASEEQAQSRSNLLNAIVESSPDVIVFALDTQYRYLSFNRKHKETMWALWGKEITAGMSMLDVIGDHPDREKAKQGFDRALSGESFVLEEAYGDELLSRQYWQNYWSPIRAESGEVVGLTCFVMNVSERRRIEEAMRANEQKLSTLFALSPLGIALTDMNGRYVEFNEAFRAICGYPVDELMVLDYWTLTPKEYEVQEAVQLESLTQTGRYGPYEKEYRQKDGTLVPIQLNGVLVTGQDGKQYIWSIVEDITERKNTEAVLKERLERIIELNDYLEENARTLEEHAVELEASQEQLKDALEFSNGVINAIPDILFEMDREGRYHGIWTQQPELLAAQKALLLNKTMHEVLSPETADAALAAIREAEENGFSFGNVIDIALPSGEIRWFELSISRKLGGSLSDTRFIVLSRDVTDRKKTEDVLRFVAEGEWMHGGESFLNALVRYLGKSLGVDYVVIDKAADKPGYVETVARYVKGELVPNVRYGLQSTPCGEVMAGVPCCHGENIQGQFPESGLLKDMQAESYVGIPLRNIEGAAIGLIAVLHERPLGDAHFVKSILQMVAPGVAAELERSRMEQVLRENYGALNEAQRISHVGNWELDLESGALVWSDEIYRIFEIDPERFDASYDAFLNAIHPDDRDAVGQAYETSLETRAPYDIEHRLLFADGRIKHVHERCETRYAEDGKPLRSLGTVQDITARKQAEESLRESYDKIRELNFHLEENAVHLEENARYLEEQATELEASQEQLKQTEAWYRSILHSAPDGMLVVDERGLIMQVNARIESMFGYESGELAGNHVEVLLPQAARATHVDQRREYFSSGSERRPAMVGRTLFGCRKDGSEFPVDVSLSRLPQIDGRGRAICAAVRDVSERHAMEVAREGALAEALRLAQLRSAFMAQMSHELRTPLNGILGHAQNLLHGGELGKKQIGGLSIIQHSGEHLLSIINGMLDHAAIEADKFELIPGNIQFETFLSTIIGMIRVRVEQKNLGFSCVVDADLPAVVRGDAQRLRQVLLNLLSNAVKFTDRGQVSLRVDYIAPQRLRFAVQDSGVGIAADQLESIFLPFEQIGETRRRAGGTGLGLAISRKLVRLMGGDIKVESHPGIGSTFSFEIEMEIESSDSAKVNAAALVEQAETRVAQATMALSVPPRKELDTLHGLALRGSMRDVMRHAEKLSEADGRYLPFVEQLRQLAKNFQTKALLSLIEQYRSEQEIES